MNLDFKFKKFKIRQFSLVWWLIMVGAAVGVFAFVKFGLAGLMVLGGY